MKLSPIPLFGAALVAVALFGESASAWEATYRFTEPSDREYSFGEFTVTQEGGVAVAGRVSRIDPKTGYNVRMFVLSSIDDGKSWRMTDLAPGVPPYLSGMSAGPGGSLFAVGMDPKVPGISIVTSADLGVTWQLVGKIQSDALAGKTNVTLKWHQGVLYLVASDLIGLFDTHLRYDIYRSYDLGWNWQKVTALARDGGAFLHSIPGHLIEWAGRLVLATATFEVHFNVTSRGWENFYQFGSDGSSLRAFAWMPKHYARQWFESQENGFCVSARQIDRQGSNQPTWIDRIRCSRDDGTTWAERRFPTGELARHQWRLAFDANSQSLYGLMIHDSYATSREWKIVQASPDLKSWTLVHDDNPVEAGALYSAGHRLVVTPSGRLITIGSRVDKGNITTWEIKRSAPR